MIMEFSGYSYRQNKEDSRFLRSITIPFSVSGKTAVVPEGGADAAAHAVPSDLELK